MATSLTSSVLYACLLVVISLLVLVLLRYFVPLRTTPAYILVPVILALALPANLILVVPIDLASSLVHDGARHGIWLSDRTLLIVWRISYWLIFALTWVILPVLGEYVDSGDRDPRDKLLYSLRSNGRYHLITLAISALGLVYFVLTQGFSFHNLKAFVMALAYAWGLVLALYLMGHGLVAVPRRILRDADVGARLKRYQSLAVSLKEKLLDASDELGGYEAQVQQLQRRQAASSKQFRDWILDLAELVREPESTTSFVQGPGTDRAAVPSVLTPRYLADLTRRLKRAKHKHLRFATEWQLLVLSARHTQDIINAVPTRSLVLAHTKSSWISPVMRYHLHANLLPVLRYFCFAVLSAASVSIVWSEMTKYFFPGISLVQLTMLSTHTQLVRFFPSQVFAAFWISYMVTCALYSVSVLPIWGNRALVHRTTYHESATWYAAQVAKLTVPLAYNFLTFLPADLRKRTVFYRFLGQLVDFTPLGRRFDAFFPILLLLPVLAALFGLYGKIKSVFGYSYYLLEDTEQERWLEGKELIDQALIDHASSDSALGLSRSSIRIRSSDIERNARLLPATSPDSTSNRSTHNPSPSLFSPLHHDQVDNQREDAGRTLTDFAHRLGNTIDNLQPLSWLGRGQASGNHIPQPWHWSKIFGGTSNEGRLQL